MTERPPTTGSASVRECFHFSSVTADFADAWEFSRAAIGWEQTFEPASRAPFRGRVSQAWLGPIQIMYERTDRPYSYRGQAWKGSRLFLARLPSPGRTICGGREYVSDGVNTCRWDELDRIVANGRVETVLMAVDERFLADRFARVLDYEWGRSAGPVRRPTTSRLTRFFSNELLEILGLALTQPQLLTREIPRALLQSRAMEALLAVIVDGQINPGRPPPAPSTRGYVVDRAIDFIDAQIHQPITTADICAALRVCARTLRYSFQYALGISPMQYLLARRLDAVHRELAHGTDITTIDEVAARWGFTHIGRFGGYYRAAFGEKPSETVRGRIQRDCWRHRSRVSGRSVLGKRPLKS